MTGTQLLKSVLARFARGFLAGAFTAMALVVQDIGTAPDIQMLVMNLGTMGLAGGIVGAVLALDKFLRTLPDLS